MVEKSEVGHASDRILHSSLIAMRKPGNGVERWPRAAATADAG